MMVTNLKLQQVNLNQHMQKVMEAMRIHLEKQDMTVKQHGKAKVTKDQRNKVDTYHKLNMYQKQVKLLKNYKINVKEKELIN